MLIATNVARWILNKPYHEHTIRFEFAKTSIYIPFFITFISKKTSVDNIKSLSFFTENKDAIVLMSDGESLYESKYESIVEFKNIYLQHGSPFLAIRKG